MEVCVVLEDVEDRYPSWTRICINALSALTRKLRRGLSPAWDIPPYHSTLRDTTLHPRKWFKPFRAYNYAVHQGSSMGTT